jgi:methanogenic corrinoid protein MtbC1
MIRWCAHCQKYLGEKPPLDDYTVTHGVCSNCAEKFLKDGQISPESRSVTEFYNTILDRGKRGDALAVADVIDRARTLRLRPLDLLIGILQPALYALGKAWECGEVTVATEHRFSALVRSIMEHLDIPSDGAEDLRDSASPEVLVVAAEGNQHFLGILMLEAFLMLHGIRSRVIFPGIPMHETLQLASNLRPRVLGISIALPEQEVTLTSVNAWLATQPESSRPICIAGGHWARQHTSAQKIGDIHIARDPEEILRALEQKDSDRLSRR